MYCSAQYLPIPYGDSGSASTSSRDGMGASRPYSAPPEDANSTRAPATRAASRTLTVPTTLTCASTAGAATEARTWHDSRECTRADELYLSRCDLVAVANRGRKRGPGAGIGVCGAVAPQRSRAQKLELLELGHGGHS